MKYDFKNTQHWKILELQAYDGVIDFSPFPPAAYRYFSELQKIYAKYRSGEYDRRTAERAKRLQYSRYRQAIQDYDRWRAVNAQWQHDIVICGSLLSDIEKAQSVQQIADIACKVIGLMTGDSSFYPRQMKKISGGVYNNLSRIVNL